MKLARLALICASLVFAFVQPTQAAIEIYDIDPVHTWVGFTVSHFFTKVPGFFSKVKATAVVDRDNIENSTVEAVVEIASITTNTPKRDDDLRSTNFFAAAKFPVMTFKSKAVKSTGSDAYDVTGVLTMKGVAKEVTIKVKSVGFGPGMKGAIIAGCEASFTLDRRDFDITADQGMIGNTVDIVIHVEADLKKP